MMHAYSELYVNKAQIALGNMLQFAVYDLKYNVADFYSMFLHCDCSSAFGLGEPKYIVGMSGFELAYDVIRKVTNQECQIIPSYRFDKTPEYWAGWALAYYEWYRNIPFDRIDDTVKIDEIVEMYNPFHEADVMRFVEEMDQQIMSRHEISMLKRFRAYAGLTQKQLAEKSGVSIRMIEQYEQKTKNLNKASADTIVRLSRALCCRVEDLMEL